MQRPVLSTCREPETFAVRKSGIGIGPGSGDRPCPQVVEVPDDVEAGLAASAQGRTMTVPPDRWC